MSPSTRAFRFTGVDFYGLEAGLSEEERAVRDTVRAFVDEIAAALVADESDGVKLKTLLVRVIPEYTPESLAGKTAPVLENIDVEETPARNAAHALTP